MYSHHTRKSIYLSTFLTFLISCKPKQPHVSARPVPQNNQDIVIQQGSDELLPGSNVEVSSQGQQAVAHPSERTQSSEKPIEESQSSEIRENQSQNSINVAQPKLNTISKEVVPIVDHKPSADPFSGVAAFKAWRSGRSHAGIDLYGVVGDKVRAMADGVVKDYYDFFQKTWAIEVEHPNVEMPHPDIPGKMIKGVYVRYAEVKASSIAVEIGQEVKAGDVLGHMGKLLCCPSMVHFEVYTGKQPDGSKYKENELGQQEIWLSSGNNEFQRRPDLIDPGYLIKKMFGKAGWSLNY